MIEIGDQVLVVGGPHHLRHGEVVDWRWVCSARPPRTHVAVRFRTKRGYPACRRCHEGAPLDLVPVRRLNAWSAT